MIVNQRITTTVAAGDDRMVSMSKYTDAPSVEMSDMSDILTDHPFDNVVIHYVRVLTYATLVCMFFSNPFMLAGLG